MIKIKRIFAVLLLVIVPNFCFGEWVGAHDGRRYVTDAEKSVYPYNKVVKLGSDKDDSWSTGFFVSPHVILTCRHCISDVGDDNKVDFYTSDGESSALP